MLDQRVQQVKNLATSPSFEKADYTGTSERWRNLAHDPRATSIASVGGQLRWNSSRWFGSGSGTHTLVTDASDGPNGITTYIRKTWTSSGPVSNGDLGLFIGAGGAFGLPVSPGEVYTISAYIRTSVVRSINMGVYCSTATGTAATPPRLYSVPTFTTIGVWTRVSHTFTVPSDTAFIQLAADTGSLGSTPMNTGDTFDATGLCVTKTPYLTPYFDGTITATDTFGLDYVASWLGTLNVSQSIITGPTPNVEVYRNLIFNPGPRSLTGIGAGGMPTTTLSIISGGGPLGTGYVKGVRADATVGSAAFYFGATAANDGTSVSLSSVVAGTTYAVSGYLYSSRAVAAAYIGVAWFDSTGALVTQVSVNTKAISADTWTLFSGTLVAPAGAVKARVDAYFSNAVSDPANSEYLAVSNLQLTATPVVLSYFDGVVGLGYFADIDFSPSWVGEANNSPSTIQGIGTAGVTTTQSTISAIRSFNWKSSGKVSVRLVSKKDTPDFGSCLIPSLSGLVVGRTYTFIAKIRLSAPQTGSLRPESRCIQLRTTGGAIVVVSDQPPNTAGEHVVKLTYAWPIPGDLRLYHGGTIGSPDVWWDDLQVIEGNYTGPYIDGDSPKSKWLGTPNASQSVGYPHP